MRIKTSDEQMQSAFESHRLAKIEVDRAKFRLRQAEEDLAEDEVRKALAKYGLTHVGQEVWVKNTDWEGKESWYKGLVEVDKYTKQVSVTPRHRGDGRMNYELDKSTELYDEDADVPKCQHEDCKWQHGHYAAHGGLCERHNREAQEKREAVRKAAEERMAAERLAAAPPPPPPPPEVAPPGKVKVELRIEPYGGGFLVADYDGKRAQKSLFKAKYYFAEGWSDQPLGNPAFRTREEAQAFIDKLPKEWISADV